MNERQNSQSAVAPVALCSDILNAMREYADQHNVNLEGTTDEIIEEPNKRARVVITIPKYIEQEHRYGLEEAAWGAAEKSPLLPLVQFMYESPAGI